MPNRILREGILTSPRVSKLGWAEEVFYRRLMSVVDDFGRYYADAGMLRAACYPRQLNKVSDSDIGKWMQVIASAALVRVYPASDGESYLQLLDFRQQTRAKASKYPDPAGTCVADAQQANSTSEAPAHVYVFGDVVEDGDGNARGRAPSPIPRSAKPKKGPIPEGFTTSEHVAAWAAEKGFDRIDEHLESFVRKCKAKGYEYVDFDLAFMEAVREDWAKLRGRTPAGTAPPSTGDTEKRARLEYERSQKILNEQQAHAAEVAAQRAAKTSREGAHA